MASLNLSSDAPKPRICHLKKLNPEQGYGFDLHAEKLRGQYIGNVDSDSPAGLAGLERGDRILAINDVSVPQENHKEIVKRIKEDPLQCKFVVIDESGYLWYTSRKLSVPIGDLLIPDENCKDQVQNSRRLSEDKISLQSESLHEIMKPQHIDSCIEQTVLLYDRQMGLDEKEISTTVDDCDKEKEYLQASNEIPSEQVVPDECKEHEIQDGNIRNGTCDKPIHEFTAQQNGSVKPSEHEELPRFCKLQKSFPDQEYGFNLHAEKNKGHFVGKVDPGSPAHAASLIEGFRIVGVNDTLIYVKTPHKEVVALIKEKTMNTDLLIVSPELDAIYKAEQRAFSFSHADVIDGSKEKEEFICPTLTLDRNNLQNAELSLENGNDLVNNLVSHEQETNGDLDQFHEKSPLKKLSTGNAQESLTLNNDRLNNDEEKNINFKSNKMPVNDIFQLSASEMRERLARNKKVDLRNESMTIRQKYEIVQNL